MNTLEQLIEASRTRLGTHQSSLELARERIQYSPKQRIQITRSYSRTFKQGD